MDLGIVFLYYTFITFLLLLDELRSPSSHGNVQPGLKQNEIALSNGINAAAAARRSFSIIQPCLCLKKIGPRLSVLLSG